MSNEIYRIIDHRNEREPEDDIPDRAHPLVGYEAEELDNKISDAIGYISRARRNLTYYAERLDSAGLISDNGWNHLQDLVLKLNQVQDAVDNLDWQVDDWIVLGG